MTIEVLDNKLDLEMMATGLADTFFQRRDVYAQQLGDGSYICIRKPLETSHLIAHLAGKITLGTYVLNLSSQTRFIVFDAVVGWVSLPAVISAAKVLYKGPLLDPLLPPPFLQNGGGFKPTPA